MLRFQDDNVLTEPSVQFLVPDFDAAVIFGVNGGTYCLAPGL